MTLDEQLREAAAQVPPHGLGDPDALFRRGRRRRQTRRVSVAGAVAAVVLSVVVLSQGLPEPSLVIEPADPGGASEFEVPPPGDAEPIYLADGTPAFLYHLDDGEVVVLDATSPHQDLTLLAFCGRNGGFEDPRHGSRFAGDGTWTDGPAPTGLARYPFERLGDGRIRVTGPAGAPPPRPAPTSDAPVVNPGPYCFDTEDGDHPDQARAHVPDEQPARGELDLSVERWQWVRADTEVRDDTVWLCALAPCGSEAVEVVLPHEGWTVSFARNPEDRLVLARLRDDGTAEVRLPVVDALPADRQEP